MEYLKDCDVAWLLGVIAGDGHVDRYFVEISDRHKENLEVVGEAVSKLGYKYVITKDLRENRYRLWVNSKKFVNFLISELGYSPSLKIPQKTFNKLCFTQGLYDAEGYVEYWKPRNAVRINFANKSAAVIDLVLSALKNAGITKPYVRHTSRAYRIQEERRRNIRREDRVQIPHEEKQAGTPPFLTPPSRARPPPSILKGKGSRGVGG